MATYRSDAAGLKFVPYDRPEGAAIIQEFSLTIGTAVANADIFILGKLPPRSTLQAFDIEFPILDTGTAVATITIGDSTNSARYSNAGPATFHNAVTRVNSLLPSNAVINTASRGTLQGSLPVASTNATDLRVVVTTAPNVGAATGTIKGFYVYTMRPEFNQPVL